MCHLPTEYICSHCPYVKCPYIAFQLKDEVTSPAGSTIVGIHSLEKDGMRGSFMSAVEAAFLRNKEMNPKAK